MKSQDFISEIKNSELCPPNIDEIYAYFSKHQKLAMDTLVEFHRICEKCQIPYQLAYGSLLGAIRDDGQIPWDYDVDVVVPYEYREKLIKALKQELSEDYYFYCPEVDKKCRHYLMRITPKGYDSETLHVDVFYLIGVPTKEDEREQFFLDFYRIWKTRTYKFMKFSSVSVLTWKRKVRLALLKIKHILVSIEKNDNQFYECCTKVPLEQSKFCMITQTTTKREYFETSLFEDTILLSTSKGTFRVPKKYDELLNVIYKDYNKIYPLKNRLDEMLNSYDLIKKTEIRYVK